MIIQGSKSQTPSRKPMKAPALLSLFSQLRTLLERIMSESSPLNPSLILQLSDGQLRVEPGRGSLHPVDVLVEGGELELGVGLVLVLQLLRIESSQRGSQSEEENDPGIVSSLLSTHGFQTRFISMRISASSPLAFFRRVLSFSLYHFLSPFLTLSKGITIRPRNSNL